MGWGFDYKFASRDTDAYIHLKSWLKESIAGSYKVLGFKSPEKEELIVRFSRKTDAALFKLAWA